MTTAKTITTKDTVTVVTEIAAPPERVFEALTNAGQLFKWWGSEPSVELSVFEMDAKKGGKYLYRCKPAAGTDHGDVGKQLRKAGAQEYECHGEVLEIDPPRLLVWSWIANWHEHPQHPTVVRWELAPSATGTRVQVTHSGLSQESIAHKDYGVGWGGVLQLLKDYLQR